MSTTHRSRLAGVLATLALIVGLVGSTQPASAAPVTNPLEAGAHWLASQVGDDGTLEGFTPGQADYGSTLQGIIALAAAGHEGPTARLMLDAVNGDIETVIAPFGSDDAGRLGLAILANLALGEDPTDVDGVNLVERLQASQRPTGDPDAGLYGSADPTFDGAFRQGLAVLALAGVGVVDDAGTAWLVDQQCDTGSWQAYRADTAVACPVPSAATFSGPDTNSTAMALMALTAQGVTPDADAVAWLTSVRSSTGGWPYFGDPAEASDSSSTGLVLAALTTAEQAPAGQAALMQLDASGQSDLLSFQVGCDDPDPTSIGGFFFQPQDDDSQLPDVFSTNQALWGLADVPFPVIDASPGGAVAAACETAPEPTDPTSTTLEPPPTIATTSPTAPGATATTAAPAASTTDPAVADPTSTTGTVDGVVAPATTATPGGSVAAADTVTVAAATQTPSTSSALARTGASAGLLPMIAAVFIGLGAALLLLRRRVGAQ